MIKEELPFRLIVLVYFDCGKRNYNVAEKREGMEVLGLDEGRRKDQRIHNIQRC